MAQVTTILNQHWSRERPGNFAEIVDTALNDSAKTLTVPTGEIWELYSIYVDYTCSADAGNRQLNLTMQTTNAAVIAYIHALNVMIADAHEYFHFGVNVGSVTEPVATFHCLPLPAVSLPAGSVIRIMDIATIAGAADDMVIRALVNAHDIN